MRGAVLLCLSLLPTVDSDATQYVSSQDMYSIRSQDGLTGVLDVQYCMA